MKLAVILHIYYKEQIPYILTKLQNLDNAGVNYDLFITSPHPMEEISKMFEKCQRNESQFTKFIPTENKGYDIAPFIHTLKSLNLDTYDYVLKLHTKGTANTNYTKLNGKRLNNALWGKILWNSLLKSPERLLQNIKIMQENQNIGMISSCYCLTSEKHTYEKFLPQINEILQQLQLPQTNTVSFVAGTMFLAKASLLKPLQQIDESKFSPTDGRVKEGTYAHIIERVFGAIITTQNHTIYGLKHDSYGACFCFSALKRFLYQKKQTSKGKTLIKICKIPVYSSSNTNSTH